MGEVEQKHCPHCGGKLGKHPPNAVVSHGECLAKAVGLGGEVMFQLIRKIVKEGETDKKST